MRFHDYFDLIRLLIFFYYKVRDVFLNVSSQLYVKVRHGSGNPNIVVTELGTSVNDLDTSA